MFVNTFSTIGTIILGFFMLFLVVIIVKSTYEEYKIAKRDKGLKKYFFMLSMFLIVVAIFGYFTMTGQPLP